MHVIMPRLFNEFLDRCLAESGVPDKQKALFCLSIEHPSFEKGSIFMDFRRREHLDGVAIMNAISKVQQSKREAVISQAMNIEMYVFDERPAQPSLMPGEGRVGFYFDPELKIPGTIANTDSHCLARSAVVGMWKADELATEDGDEKRRLQNLRRNYILLPNQPHHINLLNRCGISVDLPNYNLIHLNIIASCNTNYKFVVYARPPGQRMYTIQKIFNEAASKLVTLGYRNNHYDCITAGSRSKIFDGIICQHCKLSYNTVLHRCKAKCKKCHTYNCNAMGNVVESSVRCDSCRVLFKTQQCFDRHLRKACRKFKTCVACDHYHMVRADRPHNCNEKFCKKCGQTKPEEHSCCWVPPNDKKKAQLKKKQEKFKIIFYDFETVVLKNGTNVHEYADEQWPNMVVYNKFCESCIDANSCEKCTTKEGHFGYQQGDSEWSVTDRFLDWLLNFSENDNAILIAHNGPRFDIHFLVSRLINRGIYPDPILNGTKIISMVVKPLRGQNINHLCFKDSYLLVPLPLSALPKAFGVPDMSKGQFPYLFNHPINYGKVLPSLPPKHYYCTARMKAEDLASFNIWYEERNQSVFDFDEELLEYCRTDVRILTNCMKVYMKLATATTGWNPVIQCMTFASFSLFQLKMNHIKENQVGILPETGYYAGQKQSIIAIKYIKWLEHGLGRPLMHKLNGGEFVVRVDGQRYLLDAYDSVANHGYEFNGCIYHGCPQCTNKTAIAPGRNGETMEEVYEKTMKRLEAIQSQGISVTTVWEHEITAQMSSNEQMANFMKDTEVVTRLAPRDAFTGGRTQTYKLLAQASDRYSLEYVDFCSLYPYVTAFDAYYPVGNPKVITEGFESFEACCPYKGLVKCDVLAPTNLMYPVLGTRIGGKLIFTNCRTCANRGKNVTCPHQDDEDARKLHLTVTHVELECAIQRGYKVLHVYEVWHWDEWQQGGLFKDFVQKYIKIKQEASGWPKPNMTEAEKLKYLQEHEENTGVALESNKIEKNAAMRSIAKLQLNSVWGKMGQRPDKAQTKIIGVEDPEIGRIITDPARELTGFKIVDDVAYCTTVPEDSHLAPAPFTNVAIAAYTTAHARLLLYKAMEKIGKNLVYTDTDSLIYLKCLDQPDPIEDMKGEWLGKLTSEIPDGWSMTKFVSPAAKVYSYELVNAAGQVKYITKAKGVTLDHTAATVVNYQSMERLVRGLVMDGEKLVLKTKTTLLKRQLGAISTMDMTKSTKVVMDKLCYLDDFSTLPYGYCE